MMTGIYKKLCKSLLPVVLSVLLCCTGCEKIRRSDDGTVSFILSIGIPTASVTLTKAPGNSNAEPYEGIRTLRVLIISEEDVLSDRRILYNEKVIIDGSESPEESVTSWSLDIQNIPTGPAAIYVIANEESIGITYDNKTLTSPEYLEDNKLLLLDEGWAHFPQTYEETALHGLPMSGRKEGVDISNNMEPVSISLYRAVVKLHLTVKNETEDPINLHWVKFGEFISDRVYLFRQTQLDIPGTTLYKELRYPEDKEDVFENVVLAKGAETKWNSVYIYPNYAYKDPVGSNPYTLSLGTDKRTYDPSLLSDNINSMVRNSQYNITARITASATIKIDYEKVDWEWDSETIDVPSFD